MDIYRLIGPLLRVLPAETAQRATVRALGAGWVPARRTPDDPLLACRVWGRDFANPIGLAAGFDKDAEAIDGALALGFGFVEAGTVTPLPQPGNPRPRLFRLPEDGAVINRLGFNSGGLTGFATRLARRRPRAGIVGANLGANRDSADPGADYLAGLAAVAGLADYVVINLSSPNTPGLRDLQRAAALDGLLRRLREASVRLPAKAPPLLVKIAPDLEPRELADIAEIALGRGVDGLIVTNTTVARPASLASRHRAEAGGLSGRPLFAPSTAILAEVFRLTGGRLVLIGCGGVASGADAYAKIRSGATLVQLYTGLVYHGPGLVGRIKRELAALLRADGFAGVAPAIGSGITSIGR